MKVKITMERFGTSFKKSNAVQKINQRLRSKATISGDVITVEAGSDENKVIEILDREGVDYERSSH
jgi:hypothetical protein